MSNTQENLKVQQPTPAQNQPARPNENGTISVQAHMRIFDPKTKEVIVEKRAWLFSPDLQKLKDS